MLLSSLIAPTFALAVGTAQIGDAPDRLVTPQGVELVSDGRVFVLYAALNGLGFSEETERKGPPLAAPIFHAIRADVREGMRKVDEDGKLADLKKFLDANPAALEDYLAAVLAHDLALGKAGPDLTGDAKKLAGVAPLLEKLGNEPELVALFDKTADAQRKLAKELADRLAKTFEAAQKHLGLDALRGDLQLVVLPNPLDAQGAVRRFRLGSTQYLVVGAAAEVATEAVLEANLRSFLAPHVTKAWAQAAKLQKAWGDVRRSKAIQARFADGDAYVTEHLADALTFQIVTGAQAQGREEDYVDGAQKGGLRWARVFLGALEGRSGPIDQSIPKILARANP